ncbi:triose-phosphate isomerase [Shumkonia mesophila]|uniref:triose-phosphate isomerase n=1 Tax=Shumkonia mesophila TaxID=2838854 RepID=UPI0029349BB1|nr:triose-phosphate isomerase [Shumkonia mesophila]
MAKGRRYLIAGNWKMNGFKKDGKELAKAVAKHLKAAGKDDLPFDLLVCPPFTLIRGVGKAIKGSGVKLGAQDCHAAEKGAHTGDISAPMLKDLGCEFVIVGHSERRTNHGEKDADVKAKAEAAIAAGLTAIVCVGETLEQRDKRQTLAVNRRQVKGSLPKGANARNTVVAYEPVWAIGTGRTATPEQAQEVHALIRAELVKALGEKAGQAVRILYGGSMNPKNAKELMAQPDVDGGLIGGASLKADDFWAVAQGCL